MKKLLLILAMLGAACLLPVTVTAQNYNFNIGGLQYASGPSVPGSCSRGGSYFYKNTSTKGWYVCNGSTYDALATGTSGSGSVTGVLGTANQIVSDGSSTTPTLSIASTFTFPGTITNNLSIFGATTSAQLFGVISDETGTGVLVGSASPALTGTPTVPTAAATTNTTQVATTAFVQAATVGCSSNCSYFLTAEGVIVPGGGSESLANANQGQYFRFFNLTKKVLGNACVQVATAVAAQHFDVGVYSISGTTGTLAWHTGSMTTASAAAPVCTTPTPFTMLAQTNYIVAWCADITATFAITSFNSGGNLGKSASGGPANTWGIDATDTCTAGVLPNSITTTNIANSASTGVPVAYISN